MTKGIRRYELTAANVVRPLHTVSYFKDQDALDWNKAVLENKKLRILMRGVKVGRKKGGGKVNLMSVFQTKGEKKPEADPA